MDLKKYLCSLLANLICNKSLGYQKSMCKPFCLHVSVPQDDPVILEAPSHGVAVWWSDYHQGTPLMPTLNFSGLEVSVNVSEQSVTSAVTRYLEREAGPHPYDDFVDVVVRKGFLSLSTFLFLSVSLSLWLSLAASLSLSLSLYVSLSVCL